VRIIKYCKCNSNNSKQIATLTLLENWINSV
jgi:hypothetical protein